MPEPVRGEDVQSAVADERRRCGHRVEHALNARAHMLTRGAATCTRHRLRRAGEVEEVRSFGIVELQRTRERFEHRLGDPAQVAALEPGVVVGADSGEQRDFFAAQARHASRCRRTS